jgi:tryptophan synthase alpha chain
MSEYVLNSKNLIIPYFTLGDPSLAFTEKLVKKSFEAGADLIEIGIPFSDPVSDGPIIQASHQRALKKDPEIGIRKGLDLVQQVKKTCKKPIVFMVAANIVYAYGIKKFFSACSISGLDSCIIPDLCIEDADEYLNYSKLYKVGIVFLVSHLTKESRLEKIVQNSAPFVYLISSTGITGERESFASNLNEVVKKIKMIKNIPVCIGFGIREKTHVDFAHSVGDGAIIGSYFTELIKEQKSESEAISIIQRKIRSFKAIAIS